MDRVTHLRIRNVRAIREMEIELGHPLTVLIGDNGSGKSTIIECLEVLCKAAGPRFLEQFYTIHRGLPGLLRKGTSELSLGLRLEDTEGLQPSVDYQLSLQSAGAGARVSRESIEVHGGDAPALVLVNEGLGIATFAEEGELTDELKQVRVPAHELALASLGTGVASAHIDRVRAALAGLEVHLHFDTVAAWAARTYQFSLSIRGSTTLFPARRLQLLGFNLANAWSELRNRSSEGWDLLLDRVRLGIGDHVDNVLVQVDPGGGSVSLALRIRGLAQPVAAADLSDGQLAWLSFVAMAHLNPNRSVLALDEPELHLHPALLGRVVDLLSNLDQPVPVLLSTHSDRVLELVERPADAIRVLSLQGNEARLSRPDAEVLSDWLADYGDVGRLRASGYLSHALQEVPVLGEEEG